MCESQKRHLFINRPKITAVFGISLRRLHNRAKFVLAIQMGMGGGEKLFVAHNDLNPCPPQKTSAPSSSGITLNTSQMSRVECGSHRGLALSLHTLDAQSARVNKPQPSLVCFIFHKERKSRNLITKIIFWGLKLLKFQDRRKLFLCITFTTFSFAREYDDVSSVSTVKRPLVVKDTYLLCPAPVLEKKGT